MVYVSWLLELYSVISVSLFFEYFLQHLDTQVIL
jgi:hypothetical protein